MSRVLFEFEDLAWFPDTIRESMTDYLRYFLKATNFYGPIIPLICEAMIESHQNSIVDLCSGSGGPIEDVMKGLKEIGNNSITVTLTDKFPNLNAFKLLQDKYRGQLSYIEDSLDAKKIPGSLLGFRTIFSGIHHFHEEIIGDIIKNAVQSKAPIGIFDGGDRNIFTALGIILLQPISFLLFTPFFRPFRFSRLIFTYLIPIIPLCTLWDGVVSIIRLYDPKQLEQIAKTNDDGNYIWKSGKVKNKLGMNVAYLIGIPR